jgi:hypothetical protein
MEERFLESRQAYPWRRGMQQENSPLRFLFPSGPQPTTMARDGSMMWADLDLWLFAPALPSGGRARREGGPCALGLGLSLISPRS